MPRKSATPPEEAPPPPEPVPPPPPPPPQEAYAPAVKGPGIKGVFGHPRFWQALSAVLAVLVIVGGLFSFVTISGKDKDLTDTRASLATEESARKAADVQVAALSDCLSSMTADQTALKAIYDDLEAIVTRVTGGGDWDTARMDYEAALKDSMDSFNASWLDAFANDEAKFKADYTSALTNMEESRSLATSLDTLGRFVEGDHKDIVTAFDKLEKQLTATEKTCTAALGDKDSPAASASPAP
jgi:hypothetical protein